MSLPVPRKISDDEALPADAPHADEFDERDEERRHNLGLALGWDPDEESTLTWGQINQGIRDLRDLLTAGTLSPEARAVAADAGYDEPDNLRAAVKRFIAAVVESESLDRWQIDETSPDDYMVYVFRARAEYKRHVANMLTRALALPDNVGTDEDNPPDLIDGLGNRWWPSAIRDGRRYYMAWGRDTYDIASAFHRHQLVQPVRESPRDQASEEVAAASIEARSPTPTHSLAATVAEEAERVRARWRAGTDDGNVAACCARDALRANIANAEGRYTGGYHGDGQTAMKADASLEMAVRRHPGHELTQPDKFTEAPSA